MKNQAGASRFPNPFNPGSPVDPNDFVGRTNELDNFLQKLLQTSGGSLASMAVAGGYGVGKTSFLHKCKSIAEGENALTVYFSLNEVDSLDKESLAQVLVSRVRDKVREEVILQRLSKHALDILSKVRVKASGVEVGLVSTPEHTTLQAALSASWKAVSSSRTAIVFLIDEASILEKNRAELLLYLRAVLEQLQAEKIPLMMVPAGKFSITGPSGTGFSPLVRTFPPVILENFSLEDSRSFIDRKLAKAGLRIPEDAFQKVFSTTEGHPFVLTAYLATAYSKLKPGETELAKAHFQAADVEFTPQVLKPFFSRFYDDANAWSKKILSKIAEHPKCEASLSELTLGLKRSNNQLSPYLAKLVQDGAVVRVDRGRYKLFHHLLGEYIQSNSSKHL